MHFTIGACYCSQGRRSIIASSHACSQGTKKPGKLHFKALHGRSSHTLQAIGAEESWCAGVPEKYQSLAAARWALATLSSRTMFLEGDDAGVLMPFGDLHNHRSPPGPQLPDLGLRLSPFCQSCFSWILPRAHSGAGPRRDIPGHASSLTAVAYVYAT